MSAKLLKFELNTSGVRELLKSGEVVSMLQSEAAARCPDGCTTNAYLGTNRANVRIQTETAEAYRDNLKNNTLLHALGG